MRSALVMAATLSLCSVSSVARADIQTRGPEIWPGRNEVSIHLGGQSALGSYCAGGGPMGGGNCAYAGAPTGGGNLMFDYGYRVNDFGRYTLWIDAGANFIYGGSSSIALVGGQLAGYGGSGSQVGVFGGIKLKWKVPIPLVPYAKFDAEGAGMFDRYCGDNGFGVFGHAAGGVKYFLTKKIGVGIESGVTLGPAFYNGAPASGGCLGYYYNQHAEFYAALDFEAGVEFSF